jgi:hypothetical protein
MKWVISAVALSLTALVPAASAQTTKPDVSSAPSAQSSGTGIPGKPGSKSGPAVKPGGTVGSGATKEEDNQAVQSQDPSNIKGLPGSKSGPAERKPPHAQVQPERTPQQAEQSRAQERARGENMEIGSDWKAKESNIDRTGPADKRDQDHKTVGQDWRVHPDEKR